MLRDRFTNDLKAAILGKDACATSTLRLILAALKDRDIAARGKGQPEGIGEDEIVAMLQTMIKQRRESIDLYERGGRLELAQQEADEIALIERFLPAQLSAEEIGAAVRKVVAELGATSLKDMGKIMAELRSRYAGRMDFSKASALVKQQLS
ncbi:MAG: GatB/YqeY domain-containing protein [Alphaproteobacteria bacterium]